jgi:DNA topoisomerase-1
MKLLIVESPTKAHHIQEFLGSDWQVKASIGHVRDLEKSGDLSHVRPPEFKMNYVISDDKKDTVAGLKAAAANAEAVYLATDPDREGEAIAWHLCQVLGIKPSDARRVTYQEVTENAVKKAVANPRNLDMKLVAAQEVRRGLDRMAGWEVSGPLSNVVGTKASAGRVQTPALRIKRSAPSNPPPFSRSWCICKADGGHSGRMGLKMANISRTGSSLTPWYMPYQA